MKLSCLHLTTMISVVTIGIRVTAADILHPPESVNTNIVLKKIDLSFGGEDIPKLWTRYVNSSDGSGAQYLKRIMTLDGSGVMAELEREIIQAFRKSPSSELAGILGMCGTEESRELLFAFVPSGKTPEWNAWHLLARARRGDKTAESNVIETIKKMLSRPNISYPAYREIAFAVSYLGRQEYVVPFFDAISHSVTNLKTTNIQLDQFLSQTLQQAEPYFMGLGCPELPRDEKSMIDKRGFPDWWVSNRECFLASLKTAVPVPFLKLHYKVFLW